MIKLSKKQLKELAKDMCAARVATANVYKYENYILKLEREDQVVAKKIAYSAGKYGNSGQLHQIEYPSDVLYYYFVS